MALQALKRRQCRKRRFESRYVWEDGDWPFHSKLELKPKMVLRVLRMVMSLARRTFAKASPSLYFSSPMKPVSSQSAILKEAFLVLAYAN